MLQSTDLSSSSRLLRSVLLLLLLGSVPAATYAQLKNEVSSITGVHEIASESLRDVLIQAYEGSDVGLRAKYTLDQEGDAKWTVSLYGFADAPTGFATVPNVRLTADGIPMQPAEVKGKTRTMQDGSVLEVRTFVLSRPDFTQLAEAGVVEVTVGTARLELSEYTRRDMGLILKEVLPLNGQRTASSDSGSTDS